MGAVNAFGRMLGTHHLTVVGEVPQATVEMIGGAVRAAPPDTQTASP
jgi:sigma-E factor negative regulatory protein RseB